MLPGKWEREKDYAGWREERKGWIVGERERSKGKGWVKGREKEDAGWRVERKGWLLGGGEREREIRWLEGRETRGEAG